MAKKKMHRFRCPFCGFISWENRLKNNYPLELIKVKSNGRGMLKHLFFDWDVQNSLHSVFQKHFYEVLGYLLRHKYINAGAVKDLAEIYLFKEPEVFHPNVVFNPDFVYKPDVVYSPKVVE